VSNEIAAIAVIARHRRHRESHAHASRSDFHFEANDTVNIFMVPADDGDAARSRR